MPHSSAKMIKETNIKHLGMKNVILPSVSSQFYSFGSMSDHSFYEVPAQIDSTLNFYGDNFSFMESNLYNNPFDFAISPQFPMNYHSELSSIMMMKNLDCPYGDLATFPSCTSTYDNEPLQQFPFTKKLAVPQNLEDIQTIKNPRKRPIEASEEDYKIGITSKSINVNQWKRNKKTPHQEQRPSQDKKQEVFEIPRQKAPVRRSQKFSDKITALQKLVSPYGKTDTASVLEEAAISIILLQHEIQNIYEKLSSSSVNTEPVQYQRTEDKPLDLQSRGLCLVPVSFTQRLTKQERFNRTAISRSYVMPSNY